MDCLVLKPIKQLNLSQHKINIIKLLNKLDIISTTIIKSNDNYYLAGDKYLHYISFLGCSPYLNFKPKEKIELSDLTKTISNLNYIQFHFIPDIYCFKNTEFAVKAICPECKSRIVEWQTIISNWQSNSKLDCICPKCRETMSVLDIDWKKTAGFFQSAVLFHGIQAELAFPSDQLLALLEQETNVKWHYFYG